MPASSPAARNHHACTTFAPGSRSGFATRRAKSFAVWLHFRDRGEWIIPFDVAMKLAFRSDFEANPVDADQPRTYHRGSLGRSGFGSGSDGSIAAVSLRRRTGKSSVPPSTVTVARSGAGQMIGQ